MNRHLTRAAALAALLVVVLATPSRAQWTIAGADGKAAYTIGFLAQTQFEELKGTGTDYWQQNVFFRRVRVIGSGRVNEHTAFFFETDVPNLGKGQATGKKVENAVVLQDFALTQTICPSFKVDVGMLLVPLSHNSQQSAGSLLAIDYGAYSFLSSDTINAKVGRDYGVQARGWLAGRKLELRAGVYQGNRGTDSRAPFRFAARGVVYPFEADTAMFYTGTTLGKRKLVAIGGGVDVQKDYAAWSTDAFVDWPVAKGDGVTLQADFLRWDGGTTFASLPRQDCLLVEAGYYAHAWKVTPFVQYASRDYELASRADETRLQGGLAYWGNGHRWNVKLGLAKLTKEHASDGTQFVTQWQVMAF